MLFLGYSDASLSELKVTTNPLFFNKDLQVKFLEKVCNTELSELKMTRNLFCLNKDLQEEFLEIICNSIAINNLSYITD